MSETLPLSITRLADAVGLLNPRESGRVRQIERVTLDFFGCTVADLADVISSPYAQEEVQAKCHHCENVVTTTRIVAPFVACAACIAAHRKADRWEQAKRYWKALCPERFQETDVDHADFPKVAKVIWGQLEKAETAGQSYFLIGPSRTGKTRVAMLLLRAALIRGQFVGVLWPERIPSLRSNFDTVPFDKYAAYDVLLFDDALLTACREPKLLETVKQLLDVRMRHNRASIFTSQIGEAGVISGKEFGDVKEADLARVDALIKRLREDCKVISFAEATPALGETPF